MIYTVTLNPSLDIIYTSDKFEEAGYTISNSTHRYAGGKGVNISRMLHNLGIPSYATGFIGGYQGSFIKHWFEENKEDHFFIEVEDSSRINTRLKTDEKQFTLVGVNPSIPNDKLESLLFFLSRIQEGDVVVMGGSIPNNIDDDIYTRIAEICNANKAEFVIDVPAERLLDLAKYKPLLIKPNIEDLAKMFGLEKINTESDIIKYGKKCIEAGAKNVIVSVGAEGSYLFTDKGEAYRSYGVEGKEINSFNSRPAMIAGFLSIYMRKQDIIESYKMAAAAGSATAFVEDLADIELTKEVHKKTVVEEIKL